LHARKREQIRSNDGDGNERGGVGLSLHLLGHDNNLLML